MHSDASESAHAVLLHSAQQPCELDCSAACRSVFNDGLDWLRRPCNCAMVKAFAASRLIPTKNL